MIHNRYALRTKIFFTLSVTLLMLFSQNIITAEEIPLEGQSISVSTSGWIAQNSSTTETLYGISFIDSNFGTIVGEGGTIIHTSDGTTWSPQSSGVTLRLYDISFSDTSIGVAVGFSGTILRTINGGTNWIIAQTGWMITYQAAQMVTSSLGYAVGQNTIFQPFVSKTNNGWQSWTSNNFYLNNHEGGLTDVFFATDDKGFASAYVWTGEGAIVTNVGSSWNVVHWDTDAFNAVHFPTEDVGYAVGNNGIVVKTIDGGATWTQLSTGYGMTLHDVFFTSETTGTIVGEVGAILRTNDGGATWDLQNSGSTITLRAVQFLDNNVGYVAGDQGVILYTNTGGYEDDVTPPTTTCTLDGILENNTYISNVTVTLTATDDQSGINYTMFKFNDDDYQTYTDPILITENGEYNIYYYSVDIAGNIEEEQNCSFTIQHPWKYNLTVRGGIGITATITNLGNHNITGMNYSINLESGFILIGKQLSGITDINVNESKQIHSFIIGFGPTTITVTAAKTKIQKEATVLLFFVLGL